MSWEPPDILCFISSHDTDGINGTISHKSFELNMHSFQFAFCFFALLIIFFIFMLFTKYVTFVAYLQTSSNNQYILCSDKMTKAAGTDSFGVPLRVAFLDFAWMPVTFNRVVYSCI